MAERPRPVADVSDAKTLKQRIHDGETIHVASADLHATREQLEERLSKEAPDLLFVDAQHSPYDEKALVEVCKTSNELGVPVALRIVHPRQAHLIGHCLDLGPLAIVVPLVEDEATAEEAVQAFYYPPMGKRSWGPRHAYGYEKGRDRREYADWWRDNGILILQLESVAGILHARTLARPGVDMFVFGAADLAFSLEAHPEAPFTSFDEAHRYVVAQTQGLDIKVAAAQTPVGRL